ncbi:hypothetical protein WR25_09608 [Diploscapter pachys]|uniref:Uncharacterized protein n=1 Tax=Diploscapter pachys TaxID=2018661 RepID=A0A2A2KDA3_9BILA|nr:hypothetical protein WR25_09608 [Diploscapter pachys]
MRASRHNCPMDLPSPGCTNSGASKDSGQSTKAFFRISARGSTRPSKVPHRSSNIKRATLDPHGLALEHRGTLHVFEDAGEGIEPGAQVPLTLDVAAQPKGMLNSAINTATKRSAKVSTSSKRACSANAWIRAETLA